MVYYIVYLIALLNGPVKRKYFSLRSEGMEPKLYSGKTVNFL